MPYDSRRRKDPERVSLSTYTNSKGDDRVAVSFARSLALKIASGNKAAADKVTDAIIARIEREERGPSE